MTTTVQPHPVTHTEQTTCCIVGGGPAGAVLALLLARQGIPTTLLEAHTDFDRDFRGDTIHPSVMQIMEELGLAERLLQLPHTKVRSANAETPAGTIQINFASLKTRYPYIMMLPQPVFLDFITAEAGRYPHFKLVMGARVEELIEEHGAVGGVRYRGQDGWHELRAMLTVGADGRFSKVRKLAGMELIKTSQPVDVLWFRLPRKPGDLDYMLGRTGNGHIMVVFNRHEHWQVGYFIPKDSYQQLRAAGLEALRRSIATTAPELAEHTQHLQDWKQVSLLSIESSRVRRWHRPGLLLIGDAAHVMSPVGGVGINYAIQDAVVTANQLIEPLKAGRVETRDLAAVQRRREWPTRLIQAFQSFIQRKTFTRILESREPLKVPPLVRFLIRQPFIQRIPIRLIGLGVWPVHVKHKAAGADAATVQVAGQTT
jgi:2-polyprenyl-6-methoxyphenol hydroxylase-like FAD-dependent oxidoreductase